MVHMATDPGVNTSHYGAGIAYSTQHQTNTLSCLQLTESDRENTYFGSDFASAGFMQMILRVLWKYSAWSLKTRAGYNHSAFSTSTWMKGSSFFWKVKDFTATLFPITKRPSIAVRPCQASLKHMDGRVAARASYVDRLNMVTL